MKILTDNQRKQFHIMGLTAREYYAVLRAVKRLRLVSSDLDNQEITDENEIFNNLSMCNNFISEAGNIVSLNICTEETPDIPETGKNGIQLVDLGLPSGTLWADRNLGAAAPEGYGDYYRWGETVPFTEKSPKYEYKNIGNNIQGTQFDAATVNLGKPYMMPTHDQQVELIENCTWEWTELNGVKGIKVTGPNGNHIFFPASGVRYGSNASLYYVGSRGYCWSATPNSSQYGQYLNFYSSNWVWDSNDRAIGFPVRPVAMK